MEQAKIEDQIFDKYKHEFRVFLKACRHYGFIKDISSGQQDELHKDALVIGNNLYLKNF